MSTFAKGAPRDIPVFLVRGTAAVESTDVSVFFVHPPAAVGVAFVCDPPQRIGESQGAPMGYWTPAAEGSATDVEFRSCCLEFLYPRVADPGSVQPQPPQALEFPQGLEAGVGNLSAAETQHL